MDASGRIVMLLTRACAEKAQLYSELECFVGSGDRGSHVIIDSCTMRQWAEGQIISRPLLVRRLERTRMAAYFGGPLSLRRVCWCRPSFLAY